MTGEIDEIRMMYAEAKKRVEKTEQDWSFLYYMVPVVALGLYLILE
jgi:hypothetical protein